ncbi:MAG: TonB-dependent receptor [Cellvibrionales bacterium]|nr:TonB-dependent receptor [Cellvibrionales bacterium]
MNATAKSLAALLAVFFAGPGPIQAQGAPDFVPQLGPPPQIEETVVLGRLLSAAGDIMLERMEAESVVDILGAEAIERIGDSTVAAALTRAPGVTLVDGQFIYVRGLGERYSSSLLNGASVPSPDLTRNVLPLDIFPASILESVAVEKGFTANKPATFGGGNINIRTKGIPNEPLFSFAVGTGYDSDSSDLLSYAGGGDDRFGSDDGHRAFSPAIDQALRRYRTALDETEGSLSPDAIHATAARAGNAMSLTAAEAANRALALQINRDLDIREKPNSLPGDLGLSTAVGNLYALGGTHELGFLASLNYDTSARAVERIQRTNPNPGEATEEFREESRSTENVSLTGSANFGWRYGAEQEINSTNLFLRNTDDEVAVANIYNTTSPFSSGQGSRRYDYRFEERELQIHQLQGRHRLGPGTREWLGIGFPERLGFMEELELTWFYSDAEATTLIPSETSLQANIARDTATDEITASTLTRGLRMLDVRYTDLRDEAESTGWQARLPLYFDRFELTLLGGTKFDRKLRTYQQLDFAIGSTSAAADETLRGGMGDISNALSDANLTNPDFGYTLTYQDGLSRSYLAAQQTEAYFVQADVLLDYRWRITLGGRYEEYKQFSSPWSPYAVGRSPLRLDPAKIGGNGFPEGTFYQDKIYPSLAFTYGRPGFMGAQDFNLRLAVAETVVRPDLREVSDASYLDPRTDIIVEGNPAAIPAELLNYDLRLEWFFGNDDNLTLSAFYKDIDHPLEYFQREGAEDSITAGIENAATGESLGVEVEWLKSLDFLADAAFVPAMTSAGWKLKKWGFLEKNAALFFFSGNLTLADSEVKLGDELDLLVPATNSVRPLRGASDYVVNLQLGFDSGDGKHAATLAYNRFGERLFTAGVGEQPDAFEQPFNSLDFAYSYFVNYNLTIKAKLRNLLDEDRRITQGAVTVFEQTVGQSLSLDLKYDF